MVGRVQLGKIEWRIVGGYVNGNRCREEKRREGWEGRKL